MQVLDFVPLAMRSQFGVYIKSSFIVPFFIYFLQFCFSSMLHLLFLLFYGWYFQYWVREKYKLDDKGQYCMRYIFGFAHTNKMFSYIYFCSHLVIISEKQKTEQRDEGIWTAASSNLTFLFPMGYPFYHLVVNFFFFLKEERKTNLEIIKEIDIPCNLLIVCFSILPKFLSF